MPVPTTYWHKSSHSSGSSGDCVEVRLDQGELTPAAPLRVRIRDSKVPDGGYAVVRPDAWRRFVSFVEYC